MAQEDKEQKESRREIRRRRKKRAQIIVYSIVLVLIILLGIGIFLGANQLMTYLCEKKAKPEEQQSTEEPTEAEISEPTEGESEEPETDALDALVDSTISAMSLEDKVAGLFMVTPEAITGVGTAVQAGEGTKKALEEYPVGGLIYFGENIVDADQLKEMTANTIMYSKYPLFMGIDEEGGKVARLGNSDIEVEKVDEAATIGASGDTAKTYDAMTSIAGYLSEYGFNVDFAPVADVLTNPDNEVIGTRAYSSDPEVVASMSQSAIEGLQENHVSACMKHFPGLGDVTQDPHEELTTIDKSLAQLRETELIPYITGIEAGTDMIMVSNASAPQVIGDNTPCCMSSLIVTDVLRTELGYDGIVITDAMNMGAITDSYTDAEAAVQSIQAGVDIILMPNDFKAAYQGVLEAVNNGTLSEDRINESLHRIYRVKYKDSVDELEANTPEEATEAGSGAEESETE